MLPRTIAHRIVTRVEDWRGWMRRMKTDDWHAERIGSRKNKRETRGAKFDGFSSGTCKQLVSIISTFCTLAPLHSHLALERSLDIKTQILGLFGRQAIQFGIDVFQMQQCDLLVQDFGQHVNTDGLLTALAELDVLLAKGLILGLEEHDLREDLVGEGAGHDKGRVARRAAQVHESALGQHDQMSSIRHQVAVHLRLDVGGGFGVSFDPGNVYFDVEMADVWRRMGVSR